MDTKLIVQWANDAELVKQYYQRRIQKEGLGSLKSLDWKSVGNYRAFCEAVLREVNFADIASVLDVGCGNGKFFEYLKQACQFVGLYKGVEIVPEFVRDFKSHHASVDITCDNFITYSDAEQYDLVVNLGGLNSRFSCHSEYLKFNIQKMLRLSSGYVCFNVIVETGVAFFPKGNNLEVGHITSMPTTNIDKILKEVVPDTYTIYRNKLEIYPNSTDMFVCIKKSI